MNGHYSKRHLCPRQSYRIQASSSRKRQFHSLHMIGQQSCAFLLARSRAGHEPANQASQAASHGPQHEYHSTPQQPPEYCSPFGPVHLHETCFGWRPVRHGGIGPPLTRLASWLSVSKSENNSSTFS